MLLRMVSRRPSGILLSLKHHNAINLFWVQYRFLFWQEFRDFVSEDFGHVVEDVFLRMGAIAGKIWKYLLQLISGDLW